MAGSATTTLQLKPVAQLAAPRGVVLVDELTGKGAVYSLDVCGVTYYYQTPSSAELDYSVLSHVGQLLADLAFERAAQGSAQERAVHAQRARALMGEVARSCLELALQRVISKDFERAKPAALRCLRMLTALHGESAPELVPAYLALAEAALGSGAASKAEEYLSVCSFVLSKQQQRQEQEAAAAARAAESRRAAAGGYAPAPTEAEAAAAAAVAAEVKAAEAMRSRLHRNFGRLYMAQGNAAAAVGAFSHDILHCARGTGAESIEATPGYFNLGKAFAAQGDAGGAHACFDKVIEVWLLHLTGRRSPIAVCVASLAARGEAAASPGEGSAPSGGGGGLLGKARPVSVVEAAEGLDLFAEISSAREAKHGGAHVSVAEVRFLAALLLVSTGEGQRAGALLAAALETLRRDAPASLIARSAEELSGRLDAETAAAKSPRRTA